MVIASLVFIGYGMVSTFIMPTDIDQISIVKDGSFYDYPTSTVGDGFEAFFEDPSWEYISYDSLYDVVRFTGIADYDSEFVEVEVDFILTEDSFEMQSVKFDQEELSETDADGLLDIVFNNNYD